MTDGSTNERDSGQWRRPWDRLDLLLNEARRVLGEASHESPHDLLDALSFLGEVEDAVRRELDYAVIALRETWGYSPSDIAYAMNRPWEHDYSHKVVPIPDVEDMGDVTWREALSRYRAALKRQFGITGLDVPVPEYLENHRPEIHQRWKTINGVADE